VGKAVAPTKAVIDTNVLISAFLFARGRVSWLRRALRSGTVVPIVSRATVQELVRVLEYPKFALSREDREELLADFLPFAEVFPEPVPSLCNVECRDPDDQVFIRLVPVDNSLIFINFMNRLRAKRTDSLTNRFFLLSIRPV